MIICICKGLDDKTLKKIIKENKCPNLVEKIVQETEVTKDCGACKDCVVKIVNENNPQKSEE